MRILHVGNFNEKHDGLRFYDPTRKIANGFTRNDHTVYQFSDRDIARASTWFESRKFGILPANVRLLATAKNFSPDAIIIGHSPQIFNRTLKQIKKALPHVKIIVLNVDALWHTDNAERVAKRLDLADSLFFTTAGPRLQQFVRPGNVVGYFPNIVDKSIDSMRAFENPNPEHSLFYGMGFAEPESERKEVALKLLDHFKNNETNIRGIAGKGSLFGIAYLNALNNSRMGLNLSRGEGTDDPLYSSDRIAHYTGNGLMTMIHRRAGFDRFYSKDEIGFYDDFDDLIKKVEYYRQHDDEAREIAENGWRRSHEMFNGERVIKYVMEATFREKFSEDYEWASDLISS
jgi:glycosyltransferase involved in cell wall biosynthesis